MMTFLEYMDDESLLLMKELCNKIGVAVESNGHNISSERNYNSRILEYVVGEWIGGIERKTENYVFDALAKNSDMKLTLRAKVPWKDAHSVSDGTIVGQIYTAEKRGDWLVIKDKDQQEIGQMHDTIIKLAAELFKYFIVIPNEGNKPFKYDKSLSDYIYNRNALPKDLIEYWVTYYYNTYTRWKNNQVILTSQRDDGFYSEVPKLIEWCKILYDIPNIDKMFYKWYESYILQGPSSLGDTSGLSNVFAMYIFDILDDHMHIGDL